MELFLIILDFLTLASAIGDLLIILGLLFNYLSRRRNFVYTVKMLLFVYISCVIFMLFFAFIVGVSPYAIGFIRLFISPILFAFFIATIIPLVKVIRISLRLVKK